MLLGEPARRQAAANPEGTVTAFKRKMGTRRQGTSCAKEFTPEQLSAFLLQKIKRDAEAFLGEKVRRPSSPCRPTSTTTSAAPPRTPHHRRPRGGAPGQRAHRGGAGLRHRQGRPDLKIAVIDLGGGTLDVTIMEFGKGVFEVKATSATPSSAAPTWTSLVEFIAGEFRKDTGIDLRRDAKAPQRIKEAAEMAKIELSTTMETDISLPYLGDAGGEPKHLELKLGRAEPRIAWSAR
jgi:molecular chaperone DnaK